MDERHGQPIAEYARVVYLEWDKRKLEAPPGFNTWMDFWEYKYGKEQRNG